ncbi:hypothetical protein CR513_12764, partial [Mucuna pruriens]
MSLGWTANAEGQATVEGHDQAGVSNSVARVTQGQAGPTSEAQGITSVGEESINSLEEQVCIIEGTNSHGVDTIYLCLMPDIALLTNFKPPKFEKYKGSSCPRVHLAMYCWKMAANIHQDKILVHCFQDNLMGGALIWYVNLGKG